MNPNTYHTTVVTKHPLKTTDSGWKTVYNEAVLNVESLSGYKQQYRVSREDGVYLIPAGPGRYFEKTILGYDKGADRIKSGGTELILNRSGVNDMRFEIKYQEYVNSDAGKVWHPTSKTYDVAERNIEISDGVRNHGDVVMSAVSGNDRYNWKTGTTLFCPTPTILSPLLTYISPSTTRSRSTATGQSPLCTARSVITAMWRSGSEERTKTTSDSSKRSRLLISR